MGKFSVNYCFVVLLLAAHFHCVVGHGCDWGNDLSVISRQPASPFQHSEECHELSGCICKGATVAVAVEVEADSSVFFLGDSLFASSARFIGLLTQCQAISCRGALNGMEIHDQILRANAWCAQLQVFLI